MRFAPQAPALSIWSNGKAVQHRPVFRDENDHVSNLAYVFQYVDNTLSDQCRVVVQHWQGLRPVRGT
jgi:hypothetical protein